MASRNGVVTQTMRFSVIPISVPFEVERLDPNDPTGPPAVVTLRAWDKAQPHPSRVDIAVEGALDVYREAWFHEQQWREEHPGELRTMVMEEASNTLHADILTVVIEGLAPEEADVLCASGGPWSDILVSLGWWQRAEDAAASPSDDKEDSEDPEGPGERVATTSDSSPAFLDVMAPTTGAV